MDRNNKTYLSIISWLLGKPSFPTLFSLINIKWFELRYQSSMDGTSPMLSNDLDGRLLRTFISHVTACNERNFQRGIRIMRSTFNNFYKCSNYITPVYDHNHDDNSYARASVIHHWFECHDSHSHDNVTLNRLRFNTRAAWVNKNVKRLNRFSGMAFNVF